MPESCSERHCTWPKKRARVWFRVVLEVPKQGQRLENVRNAQPHSGMPDSVSLCCCRWHATPAVHPLHAAIDKTLQPTWCRMLDTSMWQASVVAKFPTYTTSSTGGHETGGMERQPESPTKPCSTASFPQQCLQSCCPQEGLAGHIDWSAPWLRWHPHQAEQPKHHSSAMSCGSCSQRHRLKALQLMVHKEVVRIHEVLQMLQLPQVLCPTHLFGQPRFCSTCRW